MSRSKARLLLKAFRDDLIAWRAMEGDPVPHPIWQGMLYCHAGQWGMDGSHVEIAFEGMYGRMWPLRYDHQILVYKALQTITRLEEVLTL